MKRMLAILLCLVMLASLLVLPVSALNYYVSCYEENIYAGGIVDLYAYPNEGNTEEFTYQWQYDAGFGDNSSWHDVPDNAYYSGGKTNHLQIHTSIGVYDGWEEIPFQCVVTAPDGTVRKSSNIYIDIYPTEYLVPNMKEWGYGLFAPQVTNVIDLYTKDEVNYTASAYAGAKLKMWCGSKSIDDKPVLRKSEVNMITEIHITENGHTTITSNNTSYIPYTVGQLKVEYKQKLTIGGHDLGYFDTKTVNVTVGQPATRMTALAKSDCSLLRYTYNESQKLASIAKGTTLNIIGEDGSYYQVYYNGYVGYVGKSQVGTTAQADGMLIKEVNVTIPRPVAGQNPTSSCTVETATCTLYHTDPVTWTDEAGKIVKATDKFQEGKRYTVSIWLSAKSGYQFPTDASGKPKLTGAINGDLPPYINKAYEQDPKQVIELTYTFGSTPAAPETPEPPETTETPKPTEPTVTTPVTPSHTHTPSSWRSTGAYHYKACTSCGDFLTSEDHKGGAATCTEEGTCSVCGYAYLEVTDNHTPDTSKWTACGDLYHAHLCKLCGAHCDAQDHVLGPEATETTAQTCKDCGYILEPVKNHTHKLTKVAMVEPTCTQEGRISYYSCDGCSMLFEDKDGKIEIPDSRDMSLPALGHTPSDAWVYDEHVHWHNCTVCKNPVEETQGIHKMNNGKCSVCSYEEGTEPVLQPQQETKPAAAPPETEAAANTQPEESKPQGNDATKENMQATVSPLAAVLIGVVSFIAAITATVIILKKRGGKP